MGNIFIAHVEEDADVALEIALGLEEAGYTTWIYEVDSIPGPSYLIQTGAAVAASKAIIVVISPHSLGSRQVTKEVVRAHESDIDFIPILRGITHTEFQNRQPEWREAIGAAASTSIPKEGVAPIIPRIISGLGILGIVPSPKPDTAKIIQIRRVLGELRGRSEPQAISPESTDKPKPIPVIMEIPPAKSIGRLTSQRRWTKPALIASGLVAIIALGSIGVMFIGRSGPLPPNPDNPIVSSATPSSPATPALPAPPAAPSASISGYVYNAEGQPIVGSSVDALLYDSAGKFGEQKWHAQTDSGGYYQIRDLSAGRYRVQAWAPRHVRKFWKNAFSKDNATPVSVTASNATAEINFNLESGGTISGTVKDSTIGQPLVNVSVTALRVDGEGRSRTASDQNGNYTISGLPFGQYQVSSPIGDGWGSGDDGYVKQFYANKSESGAADLVTISAQNANATGINFKLQVTK